MRVIRTEMSLAHLVNCVLKLLSGLVAEAEALAGESDDRELAVTSVALTSVGAETEIDGDDRAD